MGAGGVHAALSHEGQRLAGAERKPTVLGSPATAVHALTGPTAAAATAALRRCGEEGAAASAVAAAASRTWLADGGSGRMGGGGGDAGAGEAASEPIDLTDD